MIPAPLDSSDAEIDALDALCRRLNGFGADLSTEYVDGWLTALACSAHEPPRDVWLPLLSADTFDRAYGDPEDAAPALAALDARRQVLASQLLPEALDAEPDRLRLLPLLITWDDAAREAEIAAGQIEPEAAALLLRTGVVWAEGFREAAVALATRWPVPDRADDDMVIVRDLGQVVALALAPDELAAYVASEYPGAAPTRDQLIDDACYAVQDLRLYALELATRTAPRRVEPQPGRNDPCPCGSGRKFKKCHGAA
jgi:uncharacterized protein